MLRIRDVYPGSRILIFTHPGSWIPDPKTAMKDRGGKNFLSYLCFGVINFTKFNYFIFEMLQTKIFGQFFQRIIELFAKKIVTRLSKIWVWDPGSEIRDPEKPIPDPGPRGQKGTGSRIPDSDPQH